MVQVLNLVVVGHEVKSLSVGVTSWEEVGRLLEMASVLSNLSILFRDLKRK